MRKRFDSFLRHEVVILVGIVIVVAAFVKIFGIINFSSDWFWFLAGLGLVIEGFIAMIRQRRFDRKYKIIERGQEEKK